MQYKIAITIIYLFMPFGFAGHADILPHNFIMAGGLPDREAWEELCQLQDWESRIDSLLQQPTEKLKSWLQSPMNCQGYTPLHICVRYENHGLIEVLLLRTGADVNTKADDGQTSLHLAACLGSLPIVECLLAYGAEVNHVDANAYTPLHYAARYGHLSIVKCLIAHGANVSIGLPVGISTRTPLMLASKYQHLKVVQCLIEHGAGEHKASSVIQAFSAAARNNNKPIMLYLLDFGVLEYSSRLPYPVTLLDIGIATGNLFIVQQLLQSGVSPGIVSAHLAAKHGYLSILKLLLAAEAPTLPFPSENKTPLFYAARAGHLHIVEYLRNHFFYGREDQQELDQAIEIAQRAGYKAIENCLQPPRSFLPTLQWFACQTAIKAVGYNITLLDRLIEHSYPPLLRTIIKLNISFRSVKY